MTERAARTAADEQPGDGIGADQEPRPPLVSDGTLLAVLVLDGLLLGAFGLVFTPLYVNGVPAPMGAVLSILILPWLVRRAGEIDTRPGLAGAPLTAWVLAMGVLGFAGPGGDVLLPATWQSLLLVVGGLAVGLWSLRGALVDAHGGRV